MLLAFLYCSYRLLSHILSTKINFVNFVFFIAKNFLYCTLIQEYCLCSTITLMCIVKCFMTNLIFNKNNLGGFLVIHMCVYTGILYSIHKLILWNLEGKRYVAGLNYPV